MPMFDTALAAQTSPREASSPDTARARARAVAEDDDWLSLILEHHVQIEGAFEDVAAASDEGRREALEDLALLLTAHSIAEEAVVYPAMAHTGAQGDAEIAYMQQSAAKSEMAALEDLDPASPDFPARLEAIRIAVAHHVALEEGRWFPALQSDCSAEQRRKLTERYAEHFDRYEGDALY